MPLSTAIEETVGLAILIWVLLHRKYDIFDFKYTYLV